MSFTERIKWKSGKSSVRIYTSEKPKGQMRTFPLKSMGLIFHKKSILETIACGWSNFIRCRAPIKCKIRLLSHIYHLPLHVFLYFCIIFTLQNFGERHAKLYPNEMRRWHFQYFWASKYACIHVASLIPI